MNSHHRYILISYTWSLGVGVELLELLYGDGPRVVFVDLLEHQLQLVFPDECVDAVDHPLELLEVQFVVLVYVKVFDDLHNGDLVLLQLGPEAFQVFLCRVAFEFRRLQRVARLVLLVDGCYGQSTVVFLGDVAAD